MAETPASSPDPRVSFVAFLYSLASSAAVHFGDIADPSTGSTRPPNLEQASHVIDVMVMLEQKTKGNLSNEERQFLEQAIYELRLRFVAAKGAGGRP